MQCSSSNREKDAKERSLNRTERRGWRKVKSTRLLARRSREGGKGRRGRARVDLILYSCLLCLHRISSSIGLTSHISNISVFFFQLTSSVTSNWNTIFARPINFSEISSFFVAFTFIVSIVICNSL